LRFITARRRASAAAFWQRLREREGFCRAAKAEILAGEQQKVAASSW
jgi:hypothetical protein